MYWGVLGYTGVYWGVLGYTGVYWGILLHHMNWIVNCLCKQQILGQTSFTSECVQTLFFDEAAGHTQKIWCLVTRLFCSCGKYGLHLKCFKRANMYTKLSRTGLAGTVAFLGTVAFNKTRRRKFA